MRSIQYLNTCTKWSAAPTTRNLSLRSDVSPQLHIEKGLSPFNGNSMTSASTLSFHSVLLCMVDLVTFESELRPAAVKAAHAEALDRPSS